MYFRFTPRPMTDRAFWDEVARSPGHAAVRRRLAALADDAPERPPVLAASDYLAARRHNNRGIVDHFWQRHRTTLAALAFNRCLRGVEADDPDDRLLNWLWAFLNEPTWAAVAHLPGMDLPWTAEPRLDLAATEMTANFAEMCQTLRPWIESVSGTLLPTILHEIDRRVLTPYATIEHGAWWQVRGEHVNNWLGVCTGSILAACESLAALGQPRPAARRRAIEGLRRFLIEAFTPAGECDEGVGYWMYGMSVACIGLSRLEREELAGAVDLDRLRVIADYPRRAHLFDDMFYSGNDSQLKIGGSMFFIPWLAEATDNAWLRRWAKTARSDPNSADWRHFGAWQRAIEGRAALERDGAPAQATTSVAAGGGIVARLLDDQQVAIVEGPHPAGRMVGILGGGHNGERHNHNDLGHFLLAVNGQWIIPDLGAIHYTSDFFSPKRYTYLAASSRGHCCPLINGQEQLPGLAAAGTVLLWHPAADAPVFSLDLTTAYPPESMLKRWWRTMTFSGKRPGHSRLLLNDEFQTGEPDVPVVHVIWSVVKPQVRSSDSVGLGPVTLTLTASTPVTLSVIEQDPEAMLLRQFTESPLYRIEWTAQTDARGQLSLASQFA